MRNEKIFVIRKSGATYGKIAKDFDISIERARQIFLKLKELIDNFDSYPIFKMRLSKGVQHVLMRCFGSEETLKNPRIITAMSPAELWKIPKIGKISINEIARALREAGRVGQ
jgi:hypothetical protein